MCKVYTDVGGIKQLYHVCPPVRKIIHLLKLMDYLHVQADNPWYNYYLSLKSFSLNFDMMLTSVRVCRAHPCRHKVKITVEGHGTEP